MSFGVLFKELHSVSMRVLIRFIEGLWGSIPVLYYKDRPIILGVLTRGFPGS